MATTAPKQDPRTIVKMTSRLWSDEVGIVDETDEVRPFDPAYKFSNGVEKVVKTHYDPDTP